MWLLVKKRSAEPGPERPAAKQQERGNGSTSVETTRHPSVRAPRGSADSQRSGLCRRDRFAEPGPERAVAKGGNEGEADATTGPQRPEKSAEPGPERPATQWQEREKQQLHLCRDEGSPIGAPSKAWLPCPAGADDHCWRPSPLAQQRTAGAPKDRGPALEPTPIGISRCCRHTKV